MFEELYKPEAEKKTVGIIREALRVPDDQKIESNDRLGADLGGDSIGIIEMVVDLEEAFEIKLSDDLKWESFTVGDVVRHVNNGLENKHYEALVK